MSPLSIPKIECVESTGNYSRFSVEPLDKGVGITLGNSLRRMLLGCLSGAAVTSVKIDGIQHEFSTIPDMKEDTIEFLLNVKAIRLKSSYNRPGKLFLEIAREGEIRASDIRPSDEFEIVNPDQYLATLDSPSANLIVEFTAETGQGFLQADTNANLPIGVIPVDAIFTPIRKVNFTIEPMHIGRETSRERLVLEVWTDGTIKPIDALSQSAKLLTEQLVPFASLVEISGKGDERKVPEPTLAGEKASMPVEDLELSVRTLNSLRRGGINTVGELISKTEKELLSLRNFGQKSRQEVEERLAVIGLMLATDNTPREDIPPDKEEEL
ncbi:MAG TPA: DNA-directed RNA polymerase subunit alpha [Dehalococcoidales bacterium]|nr:DNA-directed RNA polymerase subunit alpha [Dehalococcoidales bacterium]